MAHFAAHLTAEPFWWWLCSDGYITPTPPTPRRPQVVSVDVKPRGNGSGGGDWGGGGGWNMSAETLCYSGSVFDKAFCLHSVPCRSFRQGLLTGAFSAGSLTMRVHPSRVFLTFTDSVPVGAVFRIVRACHYWGWWWLWNKQGEGWLVSYLVL